MDCMARSISMVQPLHQRCADSCDSQVHLGNSNTPGVECSTAITFWVPGAHSVCACWLNSISDSPILPVYGVVCVTGCTRRNGIQNPDNYSSSYGPQMSRNVQTSWVSSTFHGVPAWLYRPSLRWGRPWSRFRASISADRCGQHAAPGSLLQLRQSGLWAE
jgi:hypothetical protein